MAWGARSFYRQNRPTGSALSAAARGTVATGTGTRAYREQAGRVAVGDQTRYAREHRVGPPVPGVHPPVPHPSSPASLFASLPPSRYNPERVTLSEESERGLGQLGEKVGTQLSRDNADYSTSLAELERNRGIAGQEHQTALSNLAQSFQRLGVTQQERQNQAGVLPGGGAALQAAQKRLANEQREAGVENTRYGRQSEGFDISAGRLARELGPEGGRAQQDLLHELTNAQSNDVFYRTHQEGLAGQEAANNGYYLPEAAPLTAARRKAPAKRAVNGRAAIAGLKRKARL